MTTPSLSRRLCRAFTLVEILVAMTIIGFAALGTFTFMRQVLKMYYYDAGRLQVNRDIRTFTQQLDTDAVYANYFRIFPTFSNRTYTSNSTTTDNEVRDGLSGDFLLLISGNTSVTTGNTTITRLVGYYRDPDSTTGTGPVRRFSVAIPSIDPTTLGTAPLSTLLNTYVPTSTTSTNPKVIQLAQGLANGSLFYNFYDRSVMIRGQIIENGGQGNKQAISTYNFTVSPRG